MVRWIALATVICAASAQAVPRNRVAFSGGWSRQVNGYSLQAETAAALGISYGFRVLRYVEAEAGVFTALQPAPNIAGAHYFWDPNDRFIWVPFGVRFIAPLYLGRIEFSGGGGGLYEKYSVSNPNAAFGLLPRTGWGGYFEGSVSAALDRGRHFWLGAAPRWFLANPPLGRDRWFQIVAELSFRF